MRLTFFGFVVAGTLAAVACRPRSREPAGAEPTPAQTANGCKLQPGRWRFADLGELDRVSLALSHILVRHAGVPSSTVPFESRSWRLPRPAAERDEYQARARAVEIAEEAGLSWEAFRAAARRYSEDGTTGPFGGALGLRQAGTLLPWPEVLDTIAATPVGAMSCPVTTMYGTHLFFRHAIPAQQRAGGRRIVLSHDGAPWLRRFHGRTGVSRRSREEAWQLARALHARAIEKPANFAALAKKYSDHEEQARGGYFGTWSSHEVTPFPRAVSRLFELGVGETSRPFETVFGVEIVQRVDARPAREHAIKTIRLRFSPSVEASAPDSRASAPREAFALSTELRRDPNRFEELRGTRCCKDVMRWQEGREAVDLEAAVAEVSVGEPLRRPAVSGSDVHVAIRVEPELGPAPVPARFELPAPSRPDTAFFVSRMSPSARNRYAELVAGDTIERLELSNEEADRFLRAQALDSLSPSSTFEETRREILRSWQRVATELGDEFDEYRKIRDAYLESILVERAKRDVRSQP